MKIKYQDILTVLVEENQKISRLKFMIHIFNCLFPQLVSVFLYEHNNNSLLINAQVLSKGHLKLIQRNA